MALVVSGQGVGDFASGVVPPTRGPVSSPASSPSPTDGTAASVGFTESFDELPIGAQVEAWSVAEGAVLSAAAQPTAVDRSIRLAATSRANACRDIGASISTLTADIMVDQLPPEEVSVVSLELEGGATVGVTVGPDGATLGESATPIAIQPRAWYRWTVVAGDGAIGATLTGSDGSELAETEASAPDHATSFCLATVSPARVHLDSISVEGS